jgi:4-hydroxy-3-polyprenylbenzoate decarboxylase
VSVDTLSDFIAQLERAGELVRISQPVSLDLELCEIADRVMKQPGGGKALLFEHPVLVNGSRSASTRSTTLVRALPSCWR